MDNCKGCLMLKEANTLKSPVFKLSVNIDKPPEFCRKCYQEERNKFQELQKAYDYRLYRRLSCYEKNASKLSRLVDLS